MNVFLYFDVTDTVHFVLAKLMEKLTADLALLRKAFNERIS